MSSGTRRSSRNRRESAQGDRGGGEGYEERHDAEPAVQPPTDPGDEGQLAATGRGGPVAVGRLLEITATPDVVMELLVDKLKLLDYEKDFCRRKKPHRKPLSRLYFAVPDASGNQSQQFFYFISLAVWLLGVAGVELPSPKEFDDPQASCAAVLGAAKKLGFGSPGYHPSKLTVGHGREVVGVLDALADYVLERRNFSFRRPLYLPEKPAEEAEVEEEVDQAADAAVEFPRPQYLDEGVEEAFMGPGDGPGDLAGLAPREAAAGGGHGRSTPSGPALEERQVLHSKVDPTQWRLEVERVAPRLRILLNADAKDWRSHLEDVSQHSKNISAAWPESRAVLEKLRAELDAGLDKLATRERFLNDQFDGLMQQYRAARTQLANVQGRYNGRTEAVSSLNSELHRITEQLAEMKGVMDEQSTNISDATPVVRVKNAIKKLNEELHDTEVRIGVVSHTLLQLSLRNKRALQAAAAALSDDEDAT